MLGAQLTIARESWTDFWPEAEPLLASHRTEVEASSPAPFVVDTGLAAQLDAVGALVLVTARQYDKLLGYCIWTIGPNLESAGLLVASQGPWYVMPEHRASPLGLRLFHESIAILRLAGVHQALPHHWTGGAGQRLEKLFLRMGAKPLETVYSLWLGA